MTTDKAIKIAISERIDEMGQLNVWERFMLWITRLWVCKITRRHLWVDLSDEDEIPECWHCGINKGE